MPTNDLTPEFDRSLKKFTKRNSKIRQSVKSSLSRFAENPQHPSLNLEKLRGSDGDTAIFFFVGSHDAYRIQG